MKRIIISTVCILSAISLFAQAGIGETDASLLDGGAPQQSLKEVSVERFETEGFWNSNVSSDFGYTSSRLFAGGPSDKITLPDDAEAPDSMVLGTRVDFLRRGYTSIFIMASRPIPIEGITKTISVWVAGRNFEHTMYLIIQDFYGRNFELYLGKLNFQGWKKLTATVPPQPFDAKNGIVQQNYHYATMGGIRVLGFRIATDAMDSYGSYYVYLDDLRAVTDLYAENSRDPDDPYDDW